MLASLEKIIMFDQLKPIMQNGERYIVVENGEPQYVVMSFDDYRGLLGTESKKTGSNPSRFHGGEWERANVELSSSLEPLAGNVDPATVRLEDLPL